MPRDPDIKALIEKSKYSKLTNIIRKHKDMQVRYDTLGALLGHFYSALVSSLNDPMLFSYYENEYFNVYQELICIGSSSIDLDFRRRLMTSVKESIELILNRHSNIIINIVLAHKADALLSSIKLRIADLKRYQSLIDFYYMKTVMDATNIERNLFINLSSYYLRVQMMFKYTDIKVAQLEAITIMQTARGEDNVMKQIAQLLGEENIMSFLKMVNAVNEQVAQVLSNYK
jgi:hypothetical protein